MSAHFRVKSAAILGLCRYVTASGTISAVQFLRGSPVTLLRRTQSNITLSPHQPVVLPIPCLPVLETLEMVLVIQRNSLLKRARQWPVATIRSDSPLNIAHGSASCSRGDWLPGGQSARTCVAVSSWHHSPIDLGSSAR